MKGVVSRKQERKEKRLADKQRKQQRFTPKKAYPKPPKQAPSKPKAPIHKDPIVKAKIHRDKIDKDPIEVAPIDEDDYLDWQIQYLEKKLGLRKKRKSAKTDEEQDLEVESNLKKYRKSLDNEGIGSDLLDLIEGNVAGIQEDEPEFEVPANFKKTKIKLVTDDDPEEIWDDEAEHEEEQMTNDKDMKWEHRPQQQATEEKKQTEVGDFRKTVRSILNKLADSNIEPLTNQLVTYRQVALYSQHGFSDVCGEVWDVIEQNLTSVFVPQQLLAVYAAALVGLAKYIGKEILGFMLAKLCVLVPNNKHAAFVWNFLFVFGGVSSDLHAELLMMWAQDLTEQAVELLIDSFNISGFKLRKADPTKLKVLCM